MLINKVSWICLKDKKVLMVRSKDKDLFYTPGGKVDSGETKHQALIREIQEELSVELVSNSLQAFGIYEAPAHGKSTDIIVSISCYFADYNGELKAASEIEEIAWLDLTNTDMISDASVKVLKALSEKGFI